MMAEKPTPDSSEPVPLARQTVLPYQGALGTSAVTLRKFYDPFEAQLYANELAGHGIDFCLLNQNVNLIGAYLGSSQVELQVREADVPAATQLLSHFHVNPLEIEPADDSDPAEPMPDPAGDGLLVPAAAFDNPRNLFDAASTLGSAHVTCFLPMLAPRGDRPAGEGNRFVLRVREADLERARAILAQADAERAADDEPRCPRCGSYRVDRASPPWPGLMKFLLGVRSAAPREMRCYRCQERWPV